MVDSENTQAGGHPGTLIFEGDKLLKRCKEGEIGFWEWLFSSGGSDYIMNEFRYLCPNFYGTVQRDGVSFKVGNLYQD